MAEYSRFFGSEGEVEYSQPQFAEVLEKIFTNGVFTDIDNELEVTENDPESMSVIVKSGEGWINGFWYQNTEDLVKTIGASDPDNDRIDRIILRLDTTENLKISAEVLEGTPAVDPDPPELTQTDAIYEISLAQVLVAKEATSVEDEAITDEREFVAGITHATSHNIDGDDEISDIKENSTITTTTASSATPTPARASTHTLYIITALAEAATFGAPTGTPKQGDRLLLRFKDNGTARAIGHNAIYRAIDITLLTTTVISKTHYELFVYNETDTKWDGLYVGSEA